MSTVMKLRFFSFTLTFATTQPRSTDSISTMTVMITKSRSPQTMRARVGPAITQ